MVSVSARAQNEPVSGALGSSHGGPKDEGGGHVRAEREAGEGEGDFDPELRLTGEQLAATGEYERAAKSLEEAARGSDAQWLAERVAQRARELRDRPGEGQTLLHDDDFVRDLMLHYLAGAAKRSKPAEYLQQSVTVARSLADRVLEQLPGAKGTE